MPMELTMPMELLLLLLPLEEFNQPGVEQIARQRPLLIVMSFVDSIVLSLVFSIWWMLLLYRR